MRVAGSFVGLALIGVLVWLAWPDAGADATVDTLDSPFVEQPVSADHALEPAALRHEPSSLSAEPGATSPEDAATEPADAAAAEQTVRELTVRGRVLGAHGRPAGDARIRLHLSQPMRKRLGLPDNYFMEDVPWEAFATTTTDTDGRFTLTGDELADRAGLRTDSTRIPEQTRVVVTHAGHQPRAVAVGRQGWDVDVGDITLEAGGLIRGQVVDEFDQPVVGALVLEPPMARNGSGGASWGLVRDLSRTRTGADGRFRLGTHRPGTTRLGIRKAGFEPWDEAVTLHEHEPLDLGRIELSPGRVIHGFVVDEHGEPLAGVKLKLRPASFGFDFGGEDRALRDSVIRTISSQGPQEVTTVTDTSGAFRCGELADAEYDVVAAHAGREPVIERAVTPDGPGLTIVLASEALIVLTVLDDATGEPVLDADVRIVRHSHTEDHVHADLDPGLEVDSGPDAAARLGRSDERPGEYVAGPAGFLRHTLTVRAPRHAPTRVALPGLTVGEVLEHEVRLGPGARVSGQVLDGAGVPVVDAELKLAPDAPKDASDDVREDDSPRKEHKARSDEAGRFDWQGLGPGAWTLSVSAPGHVAPEPLAVALSPGEHRDDVTLSLTAGARLEGLLLDADGEPVGGWGVNARLGEAPTTQATATPMSATRVRLGTTTAAGRFSAVSTEPDGTFVIDDLPAGQVTVSSHRAEPVIVTTSPEEPTAVTLQLHRTARLQGRVLESDGRPMAGVSVHAEADTGPYGYESTETDSQGEYRLAGLDAGDWTLSAYDEGDPAPPEIVTLGWGELSVVDITFPGGRIHGRVLDAEGRGVGEVGLLAIRDGGNRGYQRATSDADGTFAFTRLSAGSWTVSIRAGRMIPSDPTPTVIELADGGDATCEFRVQPGATLQLRSHDQGLVSDTLHINLTWAEDESVTRVAALEPGETVSVLGLRLGVHTYTVKRPHSWPRPPDFEHVFASGRVEITDDENQLAITLTPYTP